MFMSKMCDNVDALLEDILSLPRWVNRSLTLLRELDAKSHECGEEAQRRRTKYLDLARAKLLASNSQQVPDGFYNDPELEAEAAAAADMGREAHALMKEKVIVLNQLLRVLRGETESFKQSLAKVAKEVGAEEVLRQSRRRPDGTLVPAGDGADDAVQAQGIGVPSLPGTAPLSTRTTVTRGHVGVPLRAMDGSVRNEQNMSLLDASEGPGVSDACSFPLGIPSTGSGMNRKLSSKKSSARSSSSVPASVVDGSRSVKRPRPPPPGTPTKAHQEADGGLYSRTTEGFATQVRHIEEGGLLGHQLLHAGPPCDGSNLAANQGPAGGRVKRSKQQADSLGDPHTNPTWLSHLPPSGTYGDQSNGARPVRGHAGRFKKIRELRQDMAAAAKHHVAGPPAEAGQCDPHVADAGCADGTTMQSAGLLVRLPPSVFCQHQELPGPKTKPPSEQSNKKPIPRSLAARAANSRTGPG